MNAIELFSGACGGWHRGLTDAGINVLAGCESDAWRRAIYEHVYRVPVYPDVRLLTAARLREDGIGPIDLLAGSPPCQDASTANTAGRGIDGDQTGLFMEFVRLADEIRPAWIAAENVPGIRRRGIDRVLRKLEEIGYACWPLVVGAGDVGAPHLRNRMWLIGAHASTVQRLEIAGHQSNGHRAGAAPASDGSGERCGQGQAWRSDRHAPGQAEQALHAHGQSGCIWTGCDESFTESEGRPGRPPADACCDRVWLEQLPREPAAQASVAATDAPDADREGEPRFAFHGEMGGLVDELGQGVASDAFGTGLEGIEGEPRDDGSQLAPLERAIAQRCGPRAWNWNGGTSGRFDLDDGLSEILSRRSGHIRVERGKPTRTSIGRELLAAFGDSILPQIAKFIGKSILRIERGE